MAEPIAWTNEKRHLSQLIPWPRNPRQIDAAGAAALQESFKTFGQPELIVIGPDNGVYNGHQRLKSWFAQFGDIEIDVRVSSRILTEQEREKLTVVLHAGATGQWNWDELANWAADDLAEWGFTKETLRTWDHDAGSLRTMLEAWFDYKPQTQPEIGAIKYEDTDVDKEAERLAGKFDTNPEYVTVTCPHCAADFYLARKDLK